MSQREKYAGAEPQRRGLLPRFRDVRIRSKLGLILIIPIAALVGLAAVRLVGTSQDVMQARDAIQYAKLADRAASLGEYLQSERTSAAVLLTAPEQGQPAALSAYNAQAAKTNQRATAYRNTRELIGKPAANLTPLLDRIDTQVDALHGLRKAVIQRNAIPLSTAVFTYRSLIANLLAYRETLANVAGSVDAANLTRGASAAASYTELTSQEQEAGTVMLAGGDLTPAQHESLLAVLASKAEALHGFGNAVDAKHVSDMQRIVAGKDVGKNAPIKLDGSLGGLSTGQVQDDVRAAQRFEGDLRRAPPGHKVTLSGDASPAQWTRSMATQVALSRQVEKRIDGEFRAQIQAHENQLLQQLIIESLAVPLMVLIAIAIALLTARSMARSLQRLREGALSVAYQSLPESVARLRDAGAIGELTPDDVVAGVRDPIQLRGRDEIGQVSEAFNVVHREAVRIAAEQATLRASVSTMFTNLARRSQLMVDRLIGWLDRMEQGEEDPDRLGQLFQLDHLATRMRRNDENLLVLAGASATRSRRDAAPLGDVLRAAQSEVEQYTRIELGMVDVDVDVSAAAVNDLVHLIAELLDNATSFSPPDSLVVAEACRIGNRAFVTIQDYGIGISEDRIAELNDRLANPPPVDVALSRKMGLVVVGRLAQRIGASVELRAARERTIAEVVIPPEVLEVRQPALTAAPAPAPAPAPSRRAAPMVAPGNDHTGARYEEPASWSAFEPVRSAAEPSEPVGRTGAGALLDGRERMVRDRAEATQPSRPDLLEVTYPEPPAPRTSNPADGETVELPIFREVESAWFQGAHPVTGTSPAQPAPPPPAQPVPPAQPEPPAAHEPAAPATLPRRSRPKPPAGYGHEEQPGPNRTIRPPAREDSWRTAADSGWRAASSVPERENEEIARTGLPRREPMAQLVPGGVEPPAAAAPPMRSPDAVRGLLSAYQRGVQRARTTAGTPPARRDDEGRR